MRIPSDLGKCPLRYGIIALVLASVFVLNSYETAQQIEARTVASVETTPFTRGALTPWESSSTNVVVVFDVCGDLNGDSQVTIADATDVLQAVVGKATPTSSQQILGDVNSDSAISAADATLILRHVEGQTVISRCGPPPILPDIVVVISAPTEASTGSTIGQQVYVYVENRGTIDAPGTVRPDGSINLDGYFLDIVLSTDTSVPPGFAKYSAKFYEDVLLSGGRVNRTPNVPPDTRLLVWDGDRASLTHLEIPSDTPVGNYFICAVVDPGSRVEELDEGNNIHCSEISITATPSSS